MRTSQPPWVRRRQARNRRSDAAQTSSIRVHQTSFPTSAHEFRRPGSRQRRQRLSDQQHGALHWEHHRSPPEALLGQLQSPIGQWVNFYRFSFLSDFTAEDQHWTYAHARFNLFHFSFLITAATAVAAQRGWKHFRTSAEWADYTIHQPTD